MESLPLGDEPLVYMVNSLNPFFVRSVSGTPIFPYFKLGDLIFLLSMFIAVTS